MPRGSSPLFRQKSEGIHVAWAEQPEMAAIQRGQLRLVQPLDDRQNGRIDKADAGVGITVAKLADATVILRHEVLHLVSPSGDVVKKRQERPTVEPFPDPIVNLAQHGCRHDKRLIGLLDEVPARPVISISPIQGGVERPGIQH